MKIKLLYILENSESVASKLMKKMGWNEGSGIGKNLQGINAPIQVIYYLENLLKFWHINIFCIFKATMRAKGAGLGAATYDMDPNDSYRDAVRKSARSRYEQLS